MKSLSECKTIDEAVDEALSIRSRKDGIGFMCLWECSRLGILPIARETCFGLAVERYLRGRIEIQACDSAVIEKCKEIYRSVHPGGCRLLSMGHECRCVLCQMDELKSGLVSIEVPARKCESCTEDNLDDK